eukprot:361753-Chlamydomonas_euryale.AAC.2
MAPGGALLCGGHINQRFGVVAGKMKQACRVSARTNAHLRSACVHARCMMCACLARTLGITCGHAPSSARAHARCMMCACLARTLGITCGHAPSSACAHARCMMCACLAHTLGITCGHDPSCQST